MVRKYKPEDEEEIKAFYIGSGYEFEYPDLSSPLFITKMVTEEDGMVVMGAALKLSAEAYLFANPSWGSPRERWKALLELHEAVRISGYGFGLDGVNCWLPPEIEKPFGRRLMRLGWERNHWRSYCRELQPTTVDLRARERVMV